MFGIHFHTMFPNSQLEIRNSKSSQRVLIVGGTGYFGRLLAEDLRRYANCELVLADRRTADLRNSASLVAALSGVSIAICAAGPFQTLPTTLAELCLSRGIHYIDFADDRDFVRKVRSLVPSEGDLPAVCSGWSTVSALSGVLARIGVAGLGEVRAIYVHMAPGNRNPRSAGTIASLLNSVGRQFIIYRDNVWHQVMGWSEPRGFLFPKPIGYRRGYLVDVPDHESFPDLFQARTVEFRTAAELRMLNTALSALAWLKKRKVVRSWIPWTEALTSAAAMLSFAGHDWGAVGVEVEGHNARRRVSVVATSGGPRIAVMPASVMTVSLLSGSERRGLVSPADWLTREQLHEECQRRGFQLIVEDL
jgi:saccharopine dehydrogenase-like NADP-dependent oxidoreductase